MERMKLFMDTEFLEGTQKRRVAGVPFWNTRPMIELISIGLVNEGGNKEYYGICREFNLDEAWNRFDMYDRGIDGVRIVYWVRDNVLRPLFDEMVQMDLKSDHPMKGKYHRFTKRNMETMLSLFGKTRREIASDIKRYIDDCYRIHWLENTSSKTIGFEQYKKETPLRFVAYYSDYDWVVFAQTFGKMINLPEGFPMYCYDLIQRFHDKVDASTLKSDFEYESGTKLTFNQKMEFFKSRHQYPKQKNEHSAIYDARWVRALDHFIENHVK